MNAMKEHTLTRRQRQILDFIQLTIDTRDYPPSIREIGEAVGLSSSSTTHSHLRNLQGKGYLNRIPSKPRSITLTDGPQALRRTRLTNLEEVARLSRLHVRGELADVGTLEQALEQVEQVVA